MKRILVWSEYVEALERADTLLRSRGISSRFVHGGLPKKEREAAFREWGSKFQVLLTAKLGEEGIDYPSVAHGILIAGAKTNRQNVQRMGRLLRPMPGKTAKLWLVIASDTTDERLPDLVAGILR